MDRQDEDERGAVYIRTMFGEVSEKGFLAQTAENMQ